MYMYLHIQYTASSIKGKKAAGDACVDRQPNQTAALENTNHFMWTKRSGYQNSKRAASTKLDCLNPASQPSRPS